MRTSNRCANKANILFVVHINLDVWGWLAGWLVYLRGWNGSVTIFKKKIKFGIMDAHFVTTTTKT